MTRVIALVLVVLGVSVAIAVRHVRNAPGPAGPTEPPAFCDSRLGLMEWTTTGAGPRPTLSAADVDRAKDAAPSEEISCALPNRS